MGRLAIRLVVLGFVLIGVGMFLALAFPCKGNCLTTENQVGFAIMFVGMAPLFYGRVLLARASKKETAGPASNPPPPPAGSGAGIAWVDNPRRAWRLERERKLRLFALAAILFFVAETTGLAGLFSGAWRPSSTVGNAVIGLWFLAMLLCITGLVLSKRESPFSPFRVGYSASGVHVEYDPSTAPRRRGVSWVSEYIPWSDVGGLNVFTGWGPPTVVQFLLKAGGRRSIVQVSPEIVEKIQRSWDEGASRALPATEAAESRSLGTPLPQVSVTLPTTAAAHAASGTVLTNDLSEYFRRLRRVGMVVFLVVDLVAGLIFGSLLDTTAFHLPLIQPWEFGLVLGVVLYVAYIPLMRRMNPQGRLAYSVPTRIEIRPDRLSASLPPLDPKRSDAHREVDVLWSEVTNVELWRKRLWRVSYSRGSARPSQVASSAGWDPGASILLLSMVNGKAVEEAWRSSREPRSPS